MLETSGENSNKFWKKLMKTLAWFCKVWYNVRMLKVSWEMVFLHLKIWI